MADGDDLENPDSAGRHFSEEVLELYSLDRLDPAAQAEIEEHLLVCEECRIRVAETDAFVSALRVAVMNMNLRKQTPGRTWLDRLSELFEPLSWKPAVAASLAVLAVLAVWRPWTQQLPGEEVQVHLHLQRGEAADLISRAAAGKNLSLVVNLSELPPQPVYRIEVVDAEGVRVWEGHVEPTGGSLVARTGMRVRGGNYWVRLFGGAKGSELLREYGMKAE